jgi:hypothetical protein
MEHTKFIYTQQAKLVHFYKNTKEKLPKLMGQFGLIRFIRVFISLTEMNYSSNARI